MKAIVFKINESGKLCLIGVMPKHAINYTFAWARNYDYELKQELKDFKPAGTKQAVGIDGARMFYPDGEPVLQWEFAI